MRVLQIIPTLDRAGAEKQMVSLATGLPRSEFDVHVCALTHLGPLLEPLKTQQIPVVSIEKRWKVDPAAWLRLRQLMQRMKPDIVHTWVFAANSYGRQAAFSARVPHVIAGERCVDRWKTWREHCIDRYLARRTDWITTNSSGVVDYYVRHGLPRNKFVVIPNGVTRPAIAANGRDELLAELNLPAAARLIGAVGRLWPQKRYKDLIWAADLLKVIRDDTHLLIIGEGPLRERLERYRNLVQIRDRVHFLGHRDDAPRIMAHLDCFWLASAYEGQSNALMEAMSLGVPPIVTDIPGNRELVEPGVTGYLIRVGDRADFARWTNVLLDDAALARQLGEAARQRMANDFSMEKMIGRYAALYRRTAQT